MEFCKLESVRGNGEISFSVRDIMTTLGDPHGHALLGHVRAGNADETQDHRNLRLTKRPTVRLPSSVMRISRPGVSDCS